MIKVVMAILMFQSLYSKMNDNMNPKSDSVSFNEELKEMEDSYKKNMEKTMSSDGDGAMKRTNMHDMDMMKEVYDIKNYNPNDIVEIKKACDGGYAIGCGDMGKIYYLGKGIKKDNFKAMKFFMKACEMKNAKSCNNLGIMYEFGQGVRQDSDKAKKSFGKACDYQYEKGCKNYAKLNKNKKL